MDIMMFSRRSRRSRWPRWPRFFGSLELITSKFTEILTEDGTASELGNPNTGDYLRGAWGDRSADFVQTGTNASGSYHVTEGSTGTFDGVEIGNRGTGGYSLRETSDTDYSFTETVSGAETWTLTGSGSDTMTPRSATTSAATTRRTRPATVHAGGDRRNSRTLENRRLTDIACLTLRV
jgi:hypothetical protein